MGPKAFELLGIELEYMLVHAKDLNVAPLADKIFEEVAGKIVSDVEGSHNVDWSNELVSHVVEFKNPKPVKEVHQLSSGFRSEVARLWQIAEKYDCMLLPTAMHPWMNPVREAKLWPHGNKEIYETYDRIFKCQGHGWSNLQSTHINLSFGESDLDFGRSHAALRALTPLIPIIASSSPYQDGMRGPYQSNRLFHYFKNQEKIPSIIGPVIPEPVWSVKDYEEQILKPMYRDVASFDKEKVLQEDWLNSRAVIAKFDYNRMEVRVMDAQECPQADLSLSWFFIEIAKKLISNHWCDEHHLKALSSEELRSILFQAAEKADGTLIDNKNFLKCFGINNPRIEGLELLRHLFSEIQVKEEDKSLAMACESILKRGSLSRALVRNLGDQPSLDSLRDFYTQLSKNLINDQIFSE